MLFEVDGVGGVALADEALVLPDGAYTTFRTYDGDRILLLGKHIERLRESARLQGQAADLPAERVTMGVAGVLDATRFRESRVRLTFAPPVLFAAVWPFEPLLAAAYLNGIACITLPLRRDNPQAKDTRFQRTAAEVYERLPAGIHEGLMFDPADGALLEGLSSNFFAIVAGELRSEGARVLSGVTRALVLDLAGELLPVRLDAVLRSELPRFAEAFITSVSRGVLPVTALDGQAVGDGKPGPITRELMQRLEDFARRHAQPPRARG